jgi:hypothetical protein
MCRPVKQLNPPILPAASNNNQTLIRQNLVHSPGYSREIPGRLWHPFMASLVVRRISLGNDACTWKNSAGEYEWR